MKEIQMAEFEIQIKKKSDKLMDLCLAIFFTIGLLLAFYYNTWRIAIGLGGASIIAYYAAKFIVTKFDLYQYVMSAVIGIFTAQYIYQTHGMYEMNFFAFIGSALLINFRNWKLQLPLAIVVTIHYAVFGYLQFKGIENLYFAPLEYMSLQSFAIHGLLTNVIFFLCGLWAYSNKKLNESLIAQSFAVGQLREENEQNEVLVAMSKHLKITNERLNEVNKELSTIFNTIDEAMFSIDLVKHKIIQLSAACEKITGYTRSNFVDDLSLWNKFIYEEDKARVSHSIKKLSIGKMVVVKCRILHKDNCLRWVEAKIIPSFDAKGKMIRVDGIVKDITDTRESEQALQESYKKILDNKQLMKSTERIARFGSWEYDLKENSIKWSDEAFRIYGYSPNEHEASYDFFLNHVHPDDLDYVKKTMEDAYENMNEQKLRFRVVDRKGEIKHLQAELIIERDSDGNPIRITGFKQDITEKVILENSLEQERECKQQEITAAVIAAQEKERSFLGEELHDNINPILATVKLYMDCAIENEDMRIELIKNSKEFISSAMNDIRKLSKSLLPPSLGVIGLIDALTDMVENIRMVHNLHFVMNFREIDETELSDKLKLTIFRICQEQVNNVLKHANAKTVFIALRQHDGSLQLSIKDDGVGFDVSRKREGVGLQNIVSRAELHGGKMILNSQIGKGCEMVIDFDFQIISAKNIIAKAS